MFEFVAALAAGLWLLLSAAHERVALVGCSPDVRLPDTRARLRTITLCIYGGLGTVIAALAVEVVQVESRPLRLLLLLPASVWCAYASMQCEGRTRRLISYWLALQGAPK